MGFFTKLFTIPGTSMQNASANAQTRIAKQQEGWNNQFYAPGLQALQNQFLNPNTGFRQAQYGQFQQRAKNAYDTGRQGYMQDMERRGLGQSGLTGQGLMGLSNQYGRNMADFGYQNMRDSYGDQQQSLARLMAAINPQAASATWNNVGQIGAQQGQQWMQGMQGLAQAAAMFI